MWYSYPNRVLCQVLDEMRNSVKNLDDRYPIKRHLSSLIEEAQTYAQRMESAMEDWSDTRRVHEERKEEMAKLRDLKKKVEELERKIN